MITNELIRTFLRLSFSVLAKLIGLHQSAQRKKFLRTQAKLRLSLKISDFPVTDFEAQKPSLAKVYENMRDPKSWALTSGTRKEPKGVPFDVARTRLLQKTFLKSMITLTSEFSGKKTFFVFASLDEDSSLTSGMMSHQRPRHFELLQAPYRFLQLAEGKELRHKVGDLSARLILLIVTQPRFLYATNPSTLSHFGQQINLKWKSVQSDVRVFLRDKKLLKKVLKLQDGSARKRLEDFASLNSAPTLHSLLPSLAGTITWDGGYVSPFLEQLKVLFPGIPHIPMYSMSTEAVETLPHVIDGKRHFLPTGEGVCYEFLDETQTLHLPHELRVGMTYTMVISDRWGLRRYDTQDIFLVKAMVDGLPDLAFVKRRGLTSSLTGEKLTEEQVLLLKTLTTKTYPETAGASFSLLPIRRGDSFGYELCLIGVKSLEREAEISEYCGLKLKEINSEFKSKIDSGRLLTLEVSFCSAADLARLLGKSSDWESQFKILPLYDKIIQKT